MCEWRLAACGREGGGREGGWRVGGIFAYHQSREGSVMRRECVCVGCMCVGCMCVLGVVLMGWVECV